MKLGNRITGFGVVMAGLLLMALVSCTSIESTPDSTMQHADNTQQGENMPLQDITFNTISGEPASLADYQDKVVLVVNTASKCGYTGQYAGLEELYRTYADSGLVVLGFPANNFGGQEPGTNEEIKAFCETRFNVTFPMMAKVSVKGNDQHPLFSSLTGQPPMDKEIKWNFSKFLLDREGTLVARFGSGTKPLSDELVGEIKKLL